MVRPFVLSLSLPNGQRRTARCLTIAHAAATVRSLAARLGVSPLALDWAVVRA